MNVYWFVLPLVVAISLVYSASRYESWPRIIGLSTRYFFSILGAMLVVMALLPVINRQV